MAQRTVCLCEGKYIGIETIYTAVGGKKINIPEKLKWLRNKSQNNELFCPCGCGANLILVAGDRNLREQHFRLKDGSFENVCRAIREGNISINSKIVLKCWLDEKLGTDDIETRVPINMLTDNDRKYEFTFLSRSKGIAVSYCHERVNLSDEKLDILKDNSMGIQIIYIVDVMNGGSSGQYPEALMKVQERQGYCLLLQVEDSLYEKAMMKAVFYAKDIDGLWREVNFATGKLSEFGIANDGQVLHNNILLTALSEQRKYLYSSSIDEEKIRREKERKQREKNLKHIREEEERIRQEEKKRLETIELERRKHQEEERQLRQKLEAEQRAERKRREAEFRRNMERSFTQQDSVVRDVDGNRWIECQYCGRRDKESEFLSYKWNIGTCKRCSDKEKIEIPEPVHMEQRVFDISACPKCGAVMRERKGQYGIFLGCSNYPKCTGTRQIRK